MSIFSFNINNATIELLPVDKRYKSNVTFLQSLLSPVVWAYNFFFGSYWFGNSPSYNAGTYQLFDIVNIGGKVLMSLSKNNSQSPFTDGTNSNVSSNWIIIQDNYIGANERVMYNAQHCSIEYALNRYFDGIYGAVIFRMPPNAHSDIYITRSNPIENQFYVGINESQSSLVGLSEDISGLVTFEELTLSTEVNVIVNVPLRLSEYTNWNENILKSQIEKLLPFSMLYLINYY